MSPRSRHAPIPAISRNSGSQGQLSRHMPRTNSNSMVNPMVSVNDSLESPNYAYTTYSQGTRHHQDYSSSSMYISTPNTSFSGEDDYTSAMDQMSAYNGMDMTGSDYMMPGLSTSSSIDLDDMYDLPADDILSRHKPVQNSMSGKTNQNRHSNPNVMPNDYLAPDFGQYNTISGFPVLPLLDPWHNNCLTPPPEPFLESALTHHDMMTSSNFYGNGTYIPDDMLLDSHDISKWMSHSGSRHGMIQPREIRPASERHLSQYYNSDESDTRSPKDEMIDKVKARNDPLYAAKPSRDGYFHCPMANEYKCSHQPTKQRCNYNKYLDSHLRPYRCKYADRGICEETRFSSNACLFRHEREAHGLHNHGVNPYPCLFPECDRAKPGNGFPRRWNQRDHMKRVHDYIENVEVSRKTDRANLSEKKMTHRMVKAPSMNMPLFFHSGS